MSAQDDLIKQILASSNTSKWSGQGYGSAEKNAADMARILAGIGITDIKQFGKVPQYAPAREAYKTYNGQPVRDVVDEETGVAKRFIVEPDGGVDEEGYPTSRVVDIPKDAKLQSVYTVDVGLDETKEVDESKVKTVDGKLVADTGQTTFGNKETGQVVPNTYTERQTGNFFGGTYEGKGNTGYGVQFDAKGNPIFYTQGASSSDIGQLAPLLTMASFIPGLQPFAMAANAAIAAKQGNPLGVITNLAGMGGLAGISGMSDIANAAKYANVLKSGDPLAILMAGANASGVTDVGGFDLKDISKTIGGVKALQSGDPLAILRYGMSAFPQSGDVSSASGTQKDFFDAEKARLTTAGYTSDQIKDYFRNLENLTEDLDFEPEVPPVDNAPPPPTRSLVDDPIKSLEESGLKYLPTDDDFVPTIEDPNNLVITGGRDKTSTYSPIDDYFTPTPKKLQEIEIVGNLDKTKEHVFDPTFGGTMPLPSTDPNELVITGNKEPKYLPTDDDFPATPMPAPTTPGATSTPKAPAMPKAPTAPRSAAPAASSSMDLNGLLGLLSGQQQPAQPAPMQDPYAHIKLMENLFGSDIDLTPAGGNTPQRK